MRSTCFSTIRDVGRCATTRVMLSFHDACGAIINHPEMAVLSSRVSNSILAKCAPSPSKHITLWESIQPYDSIELQCLKYGPRRDDVASQPGDPLAHRWRAPYAHLGDPLTCTKDVCEGIGSEKRLSRTNAVVSMAAHKHTLRKGTTLLPWQKVTGVRCHHYVRQRTRSLKGKTQP